MRTAFFKLGKEDWIKGFIMTVLGAILIAVYQALEAETIQFTWTFFKPIFLGSLGAGIGYILKNLFSNSEGKFLKKESNNTYEGK